MRKTRIIKRECDDEVSFVIQQKHGLFRWVWVDASDNYPIEYEFKDTFDNLNDARAKVAQMNHRPRIKETIIETTQAT